MRTMCGIRCRNRCSCRKCTDAPGVRVSAECGIGPAAAALPIMKTATWQTRVAVHRGPVCFLGDHACRLPPDEARWLLQPAGALSRLRPSVPVLVGAAVGAVACLSPFAGTPWPTRLRWHHARRGQTPCARCREDGSLSRRKKIRLRWPGPRFGDQATKNPESVRAVRVCVGDALNSFWCRREAISVVILLKNQRVKSSSWRRRAMPSTESSPGSD